MKRLLMLLPLVCLAGCGTVPVSNDFSDAGMGSDTSQSSVDTTVQAMENAGMLGQHPLVKSSLKEGTVSSFHGSFFLGCGSIDGSTYTSYRFRWRDKSSRIHVSELPASCFILVPEECVPTIQFQFSLRSVMYHWRGSDLSDIITAIQKDYVVSTFVHMSEEDIAKEPVFSGRE